MERKAEYSEEMFTSHLTFCRMHFGTCTKAGPSLHVPQVVNYVRFHRWQKPSGRMQLKWCLVAVIFDFLAAIQRVRDQLLHHFCREFPIGDVETKISVLRTPHILNKKRNQPIPTDNDGNTWFVHCLWLWNISASKIMTQISASTYNISLGSIMNYSTAR